MSWLITERNRAAYKPAVWSQRREVLSVTNNAYRNDLFNGPAFNGECFRLIAQAEWPDACPAVAHWSCESIPSFINPSPAFANSIGLPAWTATADIPSNLARWVVGGVVVKWWSEGVSYFAVADFSTGCLDIPVCDRVEVWAGVGGNAQSEPAPFAVRASIGLTSSGSGRIARCTTPFVEWEPSAGETLAPGFFQVLFTPPFAVSVDVLTQVPGATVPSVVGEPDFSIGPIVPREIFGGATAGDQSLLNNVSRLPVAAYRSLIIGADPLADLARFRISWAISV